MYLSIFNGIATLVCTYGFNIIRNAAKNIDGEFQVQNSSFALLACDTILFGNPVVVT